MEVTWSGWFEAKEHPGTPVNAFRLAGGNVNFGGPSADRRQKLEDLCCR